MPRTVEPVSDLRTGDTVRFDDPIHARYWFIAPDAVGTVVAVKGHLVTASFGAKTATSTQFNLVCRAPLPYSE
jgi:hypothetical protein